MGKETAISWTDHTFNIAWGCVEASAGCDHCYARTLSHRYGFDVWGPGKPRRIFGEKHWNEPVRWNKDAAKRGVTERVFTSSMTDVFLNDPMIDAEREKLWPLIRATPNLIWQVLTKHPERLQANLPADWGNGYPNVWLGVTVEDNNVGWRADALRMNPAVVHFLSVEPMIGPIDRVSLTGIEWVIVGGESGHGCREMRDNWAYDVMRRCTAAEIPFFLKQLGGNPDKRDHEKATLIGRTFLEFPA